MIPVLFKIGPLAINSFGVMAMLGFLIPTLLLRKELARKALDPDIANGIAIAAMIGGFLGARLYFIIEQWDGFLANPLDYVFTGAGLVWYGGLLGGFGAGVLYVHRKNISIPYAIQPLSYFDGHGPNHNRVFQNNPESFYRCDDGATD